MKVIINTKDGQEILFEKKVRDSETNKPAWGKRIGAEVSITMTYKGESVEIDYYELEQVLNALCGSDC